jgi:hypothetical protein
MADKQHVPGFMKSKQGALHSTCHEVNNKKRQNTHSFMHPIVRSLCLSATYCGAVVGLLGAQGIAGIYYLADKIKTWRTNRTEQTNEYLPHGAIRQESRLAIKHVTAPERVVGQLELLAIAGQDYLLDPTPFGTSIQGRIISLTPQGGTSSATNIVYMPYTKLPPEEAMRVKTYMAQHVWPQEQGLKQAKG